MINTPPSDPLALAELNRANARLHAESLRAAEADIATLRVQRTVLRRIVTQLVSAIQEVCKQLPDDNTDAGKIRSLLDQIEAFTAEWKEEQ